MSATDLEIVNEAMRLCAGSTTTTIILKALRLKADGWVPEPVDDLAAWLLSNVSANRASYAAEIRVFLADYTKGMLKPDADGWIKTPNGIDYVTSGGRAIIGDTDVSQVRLRK